MPARRRMRTVLTADRLAIVDASPAWPSTGITMREAEKGGQRADKQQRRHRSGPRPPWRAGSPARRGPRSTARPPRRRRGRAAAVNETTLHAGQRPPRTRSRRASAQHDQIQPARVVSTSMHEAWRSRRAARNRNWRCRWRWQRRSTARTGRAAAGRARRRRRSRRKSATSSARLAIARPACGARAGATSFVTSSSAASGPTSAKPVTSG